MVFKSIVGATCACLAVVSFSANSALVSRLGGLAYYDDVTDLTWLADANAAAGTIYDVAVPGYLGGYGSLSWANANAWAASLNVAGVTGWRLPDTNPLDGTTVDDETISYIGTEDRGYNVSAPGTAYAGSQASELAYMFYNTLGNIGYCDPVLSTASSCSGPQLGYDYELSNTGPFSNLLNEYYWSATEFAPSANRAWYFDYYDGMQSMGSVDNRFHAWAVHSGDVSAVPVPAAAWLFGSGLLGLVGVARRKKA